MGSRLGAADCAAGLRSDLPAGLCAGTRPGAARPRPGAWRQENGPEHGPRASGGGPNPDHAHPHRAWRSAARAGPAARYHDPRWKVPGCPQDMMDMKAMDVVDGGAGRSSSASPRSSGMRHNWYIGTRRDDDRPAGPAR